MALTLRNVNKKFDGIQIGTPQPLPQITIAPPQQQYQITSLGNAQWQVPTAPYQPEMTAPVQAAPKRSILGSIWDGITEAPKQAASGLAYGFGSAQRDLERAQQGLQDSNTAIMVRAGNKLRDPRTTEIERQRWKKVLDQTVQRSAEVNADISQNQAEYMDATSLKKNAAAIASLGFDIATLGVGTAGYQALKLAAKQGGKQFAKEAAKQVAVSGGLAAPSGGLSPVIQKGDGATIADMAKGAAVGFGVGATIPAVGYGARTGISKLAGNMVPNAALPRTQANAVDLKDQNIRDLIDDDNMEDIVARQRQRFGDDKVQGQAELGGSRNGYYQFNKDMINLVRGKATVGTYHHESVHKAVNKYLADDEIEQLYRDTVKLGGGKLALTNRYRRNGYAGATWREAAEEELANNFSQYMLYHTVLRRRNVGDRLGDWAMKNNLPLSLVKTFYNLGEKIYKKFGGKKADTRITKFYDELNGNAFNGVPQLRPGAYTQKATVANKVTDAVVDTAARVSTKLADTADTASSFKQLVANDWQAGGVKNEVDPSGKPKVAVKTTASKAVSAPKKVEMTPTAPGKPKVSAKALAARQALDEDNTTGRIVSNRYTDKLTAKERKRMKVKGHSELSIAKTQKAAADLVEHDTAEALRRFGNESYRGSNGAEHKAIGDALYVKYANDPEMLAKIDDIQSASASVTGQTLRMFREDPHAVVRAASKQASGNGKVLSDAEVLKFHGEAERIKSIKNKAKKEAALKKLQEDMAMRTTWEKMKEEFGKIVSIPRALMTVDIGSFAGRQGAFLGARHPITWLKATGMGLKMAVNPEYSRQVIKEIRGAKDVKGRALAPTLQRMGVDMPAVYGKSEEIYGDTTYSEGKWAKRLGIGYIVEAADRSYSGMAAVLRFKVTEQMINKAGGVKAVEKLFPTEKHFTDWGKVVNTTTGRGSGKKGGAFEAIAPRLGQTLFSARLWKSRLDLLNPTFYGNLKGPARTEALQSLALFTTMAGTALWAAYNTFGDDIELDARSSDFAKIKVGDTRYDILAGLQQNIVLAARLLPTTYGGKVGLYSKNTQGDMTNLRDGKGREALNVFQDMINNKLAPVPGTGVKLIRGTDAGGNPVNPWTEVAKLFIPMFAPEANSQYTDARQSGQDVDSSLKEMTAKSIPNQFGISTNTFKSKDVTKNKDGSPVNPATLDPENLKNFQYRVQKNFEKSLSEADKKLFALNGNRDAALLAVRSGKVTQAQLDDVKVRYNQARDKAGLPIDYVGVTDEQFAGLDDESKAVIKESSLKGTKKFTDAETSPASAELIGKAMQDPWPGVGEVKATNKLALDYIKMQKNIAAAPGDDGVAYRETRTFWRNAVRSQYGEKLTNAYGDGDDSTESDVQKAYAWSVTDIRNLLEGRQVTGKKYQISKPDVDKMVELDDKLLAAGLINTPKFGAKARREMGYGAPATSKAAAGGRSSGGSGRAKKSADADNFVARNRSIQKTSSTARGSYRVAAPGGGRLRVQGKIRKRAKVTMKKARA